ncbi:MAG: hypothetical protein HY364_03925 [Candidatus Aenigmarchaeota archaeon]|nr:hypothetical protein [Candidatus Aenigmarchaeota archaeon]
MRRSFVSKGQWFIISAVIISGALLAISFIFRGYFAADTSAVQLNDQSYYFYSINESIANIHASNTDCTTKQKDMEELEHFASQEMIDKGIALAMIYEVDCTSNTINKKVLLLHSGDMEIWEGQRPAISSLILQGGTGKGGIAVPVNYEYNIQADIYSSFGGALVRSEQITVPADATEFDVGPASGGNYIVLRSVLLSGNRQFVL